MWLQRVLFNVQRRLLGVEKKHPYRDNVSELQIDNTRKARAQAFHNRLAELDRRSSHLR